MIARCNFWKQRSLQTKLSICIIITNLILVFFAVTSVFNAVKVNNQIQKMAEMYYCSGVFFRAIEALAFERGRTNVALSAALPINEANRNFIEERRKSVDEYIKDGAEKLDKLEPAAARRLRDKHLAFMSLRDQADQQVKLSSDQRDQTFVDGWFVEATEFIFAIKEIIEVLESQDVMEASHHNYYWLQLACIDFRIFIGTSGSVLTAALNNNEELTPQKYQEFIEARAKADYIWNSMDKYLRMLNNPILTAEQERVFYECYMIYRPYQNEVLEDLLRGRTQPQAAARLTALSVPAFDSIFLLIAVISQENQKHVQRMEHTAQQDLQSALVKLGLVLGITVFILGYFKQMLFIPMEKIMQALKNIVNGQPVLNLKKYENRQDEIGWLVQGVTMLQGSMEEERRLKERSELLAITDCLTGLYNRHMLTREADTLFALADRYDEPVSLILYDLDFFKAVNDSYGHLAGDEVLKQTAQLVSGMLRQADKLYRVGGEEFLIVLPKADLAAAALTAEKIRRGLEGCRHAYGGYVTISLGVAERIKGETLTQVYKRADENLYRAKKNGRNQVVS